MPPRRRRRWLRITLGLCFSIGLGLVLLEVVLRLFDPNGLFQLAEWRWFYRLDGAGRIETTPGWAGAHRCEGREIATRTNALGLRGPELPAKAAGERRVLLLGDSFAWGMGLDDGDTIAAQLEGRLGQMLAGPVRVGNAGMWGTSPREWGYTLERVRGGFLPDVVVGLCYAGNDPKDIVSEPLSVLDGYLLSGDFARNVRQSWRWRLGLKYRTWAYLEKNLLLRWFPIEQHRATSLLPSGIDLEEGYFYSFAGGAPWLDEVDGCFQRAFAAFARAGAGLQPLVAIVPGRESSSAARWQAGLQQRRQRLQQEPELAAWFTEQRCRRDGAPQRIAAAAQQAGVDAVDLTPKVLALGDPDQLYFAHDYHYGARGAAQVADWLLQPVLDRLQRAR